jgi:hypothetical protein
VGAEIPIGARIIAVVDCFDALTSDRPYRPAMSIEQAIALLRSRSGTFYDPSVVETFIYLIPSLEHADRGIADPVEVRGSVIAGLSRTGHGRHPLLDMYDRPVGCTLPRRVRARVDDSVARIASAEACLFEIDTAGDGLIVAHATPRLRAVMTSFRVPVGTGVSGWVAAHRSTIRRADAALDLGDRAAALDLSSCVSTPLFVRGELHGVLTVYTAHPDDLGDSTVGRIGIVSQEIGLLLSASDPDQALDSAPLMREPRRPSTTPYLVAQG